MGAVPGGAFSAFWEPVYRMSISGNRTGWLCYIQVQSSMWMNLVFLHFLTLLVHKNGCCTKGGDCVDQEEAVMSAGGVTVSEMNDNMMLWCFHTAVFCVFLGQMLTEPHFLQMSPMPSTGWQRPAEDSPCVRKNSTGLCFSTAYKRE